MRSISLRNSTAAVVTTLLFLAGCSPYLATESNNRLFFNPDTVTAGRFDNGRMWTFDFPPTAYFEDQYHFTPDSSWFADARLSALRLHGCSASFISEDGLVLTNHHCARYALDKVGRPGEDLTDSGFYAKTLGEERRVEGMHADQLVLIKNVTTEVQKAFETGPNDIARLENGRAEMRSIEKAYWKEYKQSDPADSMVFQVVTFYNGGRYSLYGYRRYTDVRLVFTPQMSIAYFGGDYDNFTYPRYDLDCALFRVYGNDGKPLHTEHYFRWSPDGAAKGEPVFVIGNPGRTNRLVSAAQLRFDRDFSYPYTVNLLGRLESIYSDYLVSHPEMKEKYGTRLFINSNSLKAYRGMLSGLRDPYLMARKEAFERSFIAEVEKNPALEEKYGQVWKDLSEIEHGKGELFYRYAALDYSGRGRSAYLKIASSLVDYAEEMQLPGAMRDEAFKGEQLASFKETLFPADLNPELEKRLLGLQLEFMRSVFTNRNPALNRLLGNRSPAEAADRLVSSTLLGDSARVVSLLDGNYQAILHSNDPLIRFVVEELPYASRIDLAYDRLAAEEASNNLRLGKALFDVYGTSIPPDATFTLRIADGVVDGYPYNGTIAPPMTTFYGMYNRYYGFGKEYPWSLPADWQNPPAGFDLSTPLDFVMTSDIIGGNSGSPVINEKQQLVGLIFDGNIESLPGSFIFLPSVNRAVAVHSDAIPLALKYIYHADRIVDELETGKMESGPGDN